MEALIILLFIGVVLGSLFGWIAGFQVMELLRRVNQLEVKIQSLLRQAATQKSPKPDPSLPKKRDLVEEPSFDYGDEALPAAPLGEELEPMEPEMAHAPSVVKHPAIDPAALDVAALIKNSTVSDDDGPIEKMRERRRKSTAQAAVSEKKLGGTYLAWAGALMSILGVCFFLKLLYDRGLVGPQGRITIAYIFGTTAIFLTRLKSISRYPNYATTLLGLGFATYFCAAFFSYGIYHLWDSGIAFALTTATTIAAFATAYRRDSQVLACLALLGAFISLVVLESYREDTAFLFVNIAILDLVVCFLTFKKGWSALILEALWGTILLGIVWYLHQDSSDALIPSLAAVSSFGLLFSMFPVLRLKTRDNDFDFSDHVVSFFSAAAVLLAFASLLARDHTTLLVAALGLQSLVLVGLIGIAAKRTHWRSDAVCNLTIQTTVVLCFLAIATSRWADWSRLSNACLQSLIVVALTYFSAVTRHYRLNKAAIPVAAMVIIWLIDDLAGRGSWSWALNVETAEVLRSRVVLNTHFGLWMGCAAAIFAASIPIWRTQSRPIAKCFVGLAIVIFVTACNVEVINYYESFRFSDVNPTLSQAASLSILWAVLSIVFAQLELKFRVKRSGGMTALVVGGALFVLLMSFDELQNIGSVLILNAEFMARLSIVVCTLICSWLFQKDRARAGWQIVETVAQVGLAVLLAWEFMDQFRFSIDEGHTRAGALSLAWSIQAISLIAVGLRTQSSMRRKTGLVLFAVVIAKILLSDTVNLDAIGRILSFVGTGLFLLLGSYLYNRFESHVADKPRD